MQLKNKRAIFLGDSITEGAAADSPEKIYHAVLKNLIGLKSARNEGVGGTRIARQITPSAVERYDEDFNKRYDAMNKDADVLFIFGGTNDFGHGDVPIGAFADRTEYTFYGALHVLISKLINKYPFAKLFFMTPLHRLSENVTVNEIGIPCVPLKKYVEAIKEVAEYYSIPVLDLWGESGMQPVIKIVREIYMPDGLHPSDAGAKIIAEKAYNFIKNL